MGKFWTKDPDLLSSSVAQPVERKARGRILSCAQLDRQDHAGPSSLPTRGRRCKSPRVKRSRSLCGVPTTHDSRRICKAIEAISPILERRRRNRYREVDDSIYQEDKSNLSNENIRHRMDMLLVAREDIAGKYPEEKQYTNRKRNTDKELCKNTSNRDIKYKEFYPNNNSKDNQEKDLSRKKKQKDNWVKGSERNRANSELTTQHVARPTLSTLTAVRTSNFRIRLYHQLNVVERSSKKPSHLHKSPFNPRSLPTSFANFSSSFGFGRRAELEFERSKPIAMDTMRTNDSELGDHDRKWPEGPSSRSEGGSDNEDVFALDIEPTSKYMR